MTKKSRKGGLVAIVAAGTVISVVLLAPKGGPEQAPVDVTATTLVPVQTTTATTTTVPPTTTTTVAPAPSPQAVPQPRPQKVPTTTAQAAAPSRKPHYVIVDKDGPVPNIEPPTKLWVRGLTAAECPDWGGTYDGSTGLCRNVDY